MYPWPHPLKKKIVFGGVKSVKNDPIFEQIFGPKKPLIFATETLILNIGQTKTYFAYK